MGYSVLLSLKRKNPPGKNSYWLPMDAAEKIWKPGLIEASVEINQLWKSSE